MLLDIDRLEVLLDNVRERLLIANEDGSLNALLTKIGWADLLQEDDLGFYSHPSGKIIVLGGSECPEKRLLGVAKELGFDKNRFEFCLDYEEVVRYNYRKLQCQPQYRVVLVGPIPHKTLGTSGYSSVITALEKESWYPRVERLTANEALKITKSNFKAKLMELLESGFLVA
jgi:hypothetical protein